MDPGALLGLLGAVIVGIFSLVGVRYSMRVQERSEERSREEVAEQLLRQYRDPLVRAAFDLQSRLYNIIANDLASRVQARLRGIGASSATIRLPATMDLPSNPTSVSLGSAFHEGISIGVETLDRLHPL